jgi:hypothetical protein
LPGLLQAWLYWNKAECTVVVAFRGTEQGKWKVGMRPAARPPARLPACLPAG